MTRCAFFQHILAWTCSYGKTISETGFKHERVRQSLKWKFWKCILEVENRKHHSKLYHRHPSFSFTRVSLDRARQVFENTFLAFENFKILIELMAFVYFSLPLTQSFGRSFLPLTPKWNVKKLMVLKLNF